jgi:hypothetical protein
MHSFLAVTRLWPFKLEIYGWIVCVQWEQTRKNFAERPINWFLIVIYDASRSDIFYDFYHPQIGILQCKKIITKNFVIKWHSKFSGSCKLWEMIEDCEHCKGWKYIKSSIRKIALKICTCQNKSWSFPILNNVISATLSRHNTTTRKKSLTQNVFGAKF